jgi:aryl-alcohol dehydrogenase-like predicted oxidoreductase
MRRRSFLKTVGGTAGLALTGDRAVAIDPAPTAEHAVGGIPRRALGRTGASLSVVGFPGLALIHYDQKQSTEGLHAAVDRGANYFDVAPAYGKGECETKMGIGLQGIARDRYFLSCKTKKRDKAGARQELEQSLKLLKTDHFDLYQLHHLRWREEVDQCFGPGGAMDTLLKARKQGLVKYLGFSAHTTKAALWAMKAFHFDTVMFPIDFVELLHFGFGKPVLDLAREQGVSVLAIKAMSFGAWPKDAKRTRKWWYRSAETPEEVSLAVRFALGQPNVISIIPPSFIDLYEKAIDAAKTSMAPLTAEELKRLDEIAQQSGSIFQHDEKQAGCAPDRRRHGLASPYDEGCGHWA